MFKKNRKKRKRGREMYFLTFYDRTDFFISINDICKNEKM